MKPCSARIFHTEDESAALFERWSRGAPATVSERHAARAPRFREISGLAVVVALFGWTAGAIAATAPRSLATGQESPRGPVPGIVIDVSPDPDHVYLGSPSLAILPDGAYVASHDWFGPGTGFDRSTVLASSDRGVTWAKIADVTGQWWSTLFVHHGALYLIGTSREYGHGVIRRSDDGGRTWTTPHDARSGLLLNGRYHCAPMPVVAHGGRLWRAFEAVEGEGGWPRHFRAMVLSVPETADLLDADNWTRTNVLEFAPAWLNAKRPGWLEGNVVVTPEGGLVNLLRLHAEPGLDDRFELAGGAAGIPRFEVAAMTTIADGGRALRFDPSRGFFHFPGSQSKFTIRFDPRSRRYWSLVQKITNPHAGYDWEHSPYHQRNVLLLTSSADLRAWREECVVLRYREGKVITKESGVGFQYVDWQFDGDDLVAVCRTAWGGHNYHDANYLTFHRVKMFRALTAADATLDLESTASRR